MVYRVLIGSPIHQKKDIVQEFFESLSQLHQDNLEIDFVFIDDQNEHQTLQEFALLHKNTRIITAQAETEESPGPYLCDEITHQWRENLIWKVAAFKDELITLAQREGYDYLFLVDSDLYLHSKTLVHLIQLQKDIVSEVFWTKWSPDLQPLPQVWVSDQYKLYHSSREENLTETDINQKTLKFLKQLSQPGAYKVGGLGACTLISAKALAAGVSFKEIYNLGLIGEDRHFCIRAAALGFELFADTHYPPYHIYRESELAGLREYKNQLTKVKKFFIPSASQTGITLGMLVRNEADRYLREVLNQAASYISHAVILDDASEDDSVGICKSILRDKGIPLTIVSNTEAGFHNEILLRKQLWEMLVSTHPTWILCLDADEIFEESAPSVLKTLTARTDVNYFAFRLYDMWSSTHYREDSNWMAHHHYRPFLHRYNPNFNYLWKETPQHCGRFPANILDLQGELSSLRIKHLGWMNPKERLFKYFRYQRLDPNADYGSASQYESILDPNPKLLPWQE